MKKCIKCHKSKKLEEFYRDKRNKTNPEARQGKCKKCLYAYNKQRALASKELKDATDAEFVSTRGHYLIWDKVNISSKCNHCWMWTGSASMHLGKPTPSVVMNNKGFNVRNIVYIMYYGEAYGSYTYKTNCGKDLCVNPIHISLKEYEPKKGKTTKKTS